MHAESRAGSRAGCFADDEMPDSACIFAGKGGWLL